MSENETVEKAPTEPQETPALEALRSLEGDLLRSRAEAASLKETIASLRRDLAESRNANLLAVRAADKAVKAYRKVAEDAKAETDRISVASARERIAFRKAGLDGLVDAGGSPIAPVPEMLRIGLAPEEGWAKRACLLLEKAEGERAHESILSLHARIGNKAPEACVCEYCVLRRENTDLKRRVAELEPRKAKATVAAPVAPAAPGKPAAAAPVPAKEAKKEVKKEKKK